MKLKGLWIALGVAVLGFVSFGVGVDGIGFEGKESTLFIWVGIGLMGFGGVRFVYWVISNLSNFARAAGGLAAKGANHVDTLKDAFKEGRNK